MPLPNFFVIGAPKAGTTALYRALRQHPDIYLPKLKEPHFFSSDREGRTGISEPLNYFALFAEVTTERAIGEASASYLASRLAAQRIRSSSRRQRWSRCFATRSSAPTPRTGIT